MSTGVGKEIFKKVVKELEENYHVEYATLNVCGFWCATNTKTIGVAWNT